MTTLLPAPFLFRYQLPVRHIERLPKRGRRLLDLPSNCALPDFGELQAASPGPDEPAQEAKAAKAPAVSVAGAVRPFAELRAAWNARGVGLSVRVRGKKTPCVYDANAVSDSDSLHVWFDTRNTKNIHRANRFCHYYCLLPAAESGKPQVLQLPIAQAREQAPQVQDSARVANQSLKDGYRMEAWFPAESLHGFAPAEEEASERDPLIGFYYCVRDQELGEQVLSVGWEFPIAHDPSLWATLELTR